MTDRVMLAASSTSSMAAGKGTMITSTLAIMPTGRTRLCTSVALSAYQSSLAPDDPYLTISERPAWALLDRLADEAGAGA